VPRIKEIIIKKTIEEEPKMLDILDDYYLIGFEKFFIKSIKEILKTENPETLKSPKSPQKK